jgi:hypothetical protein
MYKILIIVVILLTKTIAFAQNDNQTPNVTQEYDLLKAPVSPASNLLGFAQSEIDKPTDVSEFIVTLQSTSNSYTQLPSNYAIDIAPYWLLKSKKIGDITTNGLSASSGKNVIPQSLVLSFAIKNVDSTSLNFNKENTYAGFGFKFSIYRGEYDTGTKNSLAKIEKLQEVKLKAMDKNLDNTLEELADKITDLQKARKEIFKNIDFKDESEDNIMLIKLLYKKAEKIDLEIEQKMEALLKTGETYKEITTIDEELKKEASKFQLTRTGFTWDIAGGISGEFYNKSFDQGKIYNAGIWTTIGYTTEKSGAFLGLVRYLYNPERIFALDNITNEFNSLATLDTGIRYILGESQAKLNASLEAIYRSYLTENDANNSWRLMFNIDYAILKNQKLTFSFGKNYDGTTTKDGNLIAALGMVLGFGNNR